MMVEEEDDLRLVLSSSEEDKDDSDSDDGMIQIKNIEKWALVLFLRGKKNWKIRVFLRKIGKLKQEDRKTNPKGP